MLGCLQGSALGQWHETSQCLLGAHTCCWRVAKVFRVVELRLRSGPRVGSVRAGRGLSAVQHM